MALNLQKELQTIIKEGFMMKQSRFLKTWRQRWFVLTSGALLTFKERRVYNSPTQVIPLKSISSIKSCQQEVDKQYAFKIDCEQATFFVAATSNAEKEQWIGQIGKAMVKMNNK